MGEGCLGCGWKAEEDLIEREGAELEVVLRWDRDEIGGKGSGVMRG